MEQWEKEGQFPAKKVFKTLGNAGLLGVTKPTGWHLIIYRNDICKSRQILGNFQGLSVFFSFWSKLFNMLFHLNDSLELNTAHFYSERWEQIQHVINGNRN